MSDWLSKIMLFFFPAMIIFCMLFLCFFFLSVRTVLILRLRRREHRKEIIRRWKKQRKLRKAAYARIKRAGNRPQG